MLMGACSKINKIKKAARSGEREKGKSLWTIFPLLFFLSSGEAGAHFFVVHFCLLSTSEPYDSNYV